MAMKFCAHHDDGALLGTALWPLLTAMLSWSTIGIWTFKGWLQNKKMVPCVATMSICPSASLWSGTINCIFLVSFSWGLVKKLFGKSCQRSMNHLGDSHTVHISWPVWMKGGVGELHEMPWSKYNCYENACIKEPYFTFGHKWKFFPIFCTFLVKLE